MDVPHEYIESMRGPASVSEMKLSPHESLQQGALGFFGGGGGLRFVADRRLVAEFSAASAAALLPAGRGGLFGGGAGRCGELPPISTCTALSFASYAGLGVPTGVPQPWPPLSDRGVASPGL